MPQALAYVLSYLVEYGILTVGGAVIVGNIVVSLAVSFLINKALSLLAPSRSKTSGLQAQQFTINDPIAPRTIIYGETKTSGTLGFIAASNKPSSNKNEYLWVVILLADHQCESITDIWLDSIKILDVAINPTTGVVSGGSPAWNGKLRIWKHLGTSAQVVDPFLFAAFATWTAAHTLTGVTYIVVCMERDPKVFTQGNPQNYFARVRGKRLYDCRLDSTNGGSGSHRLANPSTWAWSANTALCVADYITGGSCYYDTTTITELTKRGLCDSRIDWTQMAAAANYCDDQLPIPDSPDEARYSTNGILTTMLTHSENMGRLLSSGAAALTYTAGLWRLFVGQYDTPTISVDDDDLTGAIEVSTSVGENGLYNAVSAVITDKDREYQSVTSYMRTNPGYEISDGRRIPITIDLPMVVTDTQAQRLCEIENRQGRNQTVITLNLGLNGFKIPVWNTFTGIFAEFGYASKVFRCTHWALNPWPPGVQIIARDEYPTTYPDFSQLTDFGTPTSTGIGNQFDLPDAPVSLKVTGLANAILLEWGTPTTVFANTKYEVQESTSSDMLTSPTTFDPVADLQMTLAKIVTTTFYYRVRVTRAGQVSDWMPANGGTSGKTTSLNTAFSAAITGGPAVASGSSSSQTTNAVVAAGAGGTPTYTYAWTFLSGGSGITITSASSASTTFSSTGLAAPETRTGVARCTVKDNAGAGATLTVDVPVSTQRLSFSVVANNVTQHKSGFSGSGTVSSSGKPPNTTPSGGTAPYTYVWSYVSTSSGNTPSISLATAQNPYWSASVTDGTDSNSLWRVTATDAASATAFIEITVNLVWNSTQ